MSTEDIMKGTYKIASYHVQSYHTVSTLFIVLKGSLLHWTHNAVCVAYSSCGHLMRDLWTLLGSIATCVQPA